MSGLVEELRAVRRKLRGSHWSEHVRFGLFSEAADEITSLRASVLGLEGALDVIERRAENYARQCTIGAAFDHGAAFAELDHLAWDALSAHRDQGDIASGFEKQAGAPAPVPAWVKYDGTGRPFPNGTPLEVMSLKGEVRSVDFTSEITWQVGVDRDDIAFYRLALLSTPSGEK